MEDKNYETYTQHLKKVVHTRQSAESMLKRALASTHYVELTDEQQKEVRREVERSKELIINGNLILKEITAQESIGDMHADDLERAYQLFNEALEEADNIIKLIRKLKDESTQ